MRTPTLTIGQTPIAEQTTANDPSGFISRGFDKRQTEKFRGLVEGWLRESIHRSEIPEDIAAMAFPDTLPLYTADRVDPDSSSLHSSAKIADACAVEGRMGYMSHGRDLVVNVHPSVLQDHLQQMEMRSQVPHMVAALITSKFSNFFNFAREEAWTLALESQIPGIQIQEKGARPPRRTFQVVATTGGLSMPDDAALAATNSTLDPLSLAGATAFNELELSELWPLYRELLQHADRDGLCPTTEQQDEAIRRCLPEHADTILSHPSFREATLGNHEIIFAVRNRAYVILCPFEVSEHGNFFEQEQAKLAKWNPRKIKISRTKDACRLSVLDKEQKVMSGTQAKVVDAAHEFFNFVSVAEIDADLRDHYHPLCHGYRLSTGKLFLDVPRTISPTAKRKRTHRPGK